MERIGDSRNHDPGLQGLGVDDELEPELVRIVHFLEQLLRVFSTDVYDKIPAGDVYGCVKLLPGRLSSGFFRVHADEHHHRLIDGRAIFEQKISVKSEKGRCCYGGS